MKLKYFLLALLLAVSSVGLSQVTLYSTNFGTTSGSYPAGWVSSNTTNGFQAVTTSASGTYTGASGSINARFPNTGPNGVTHTLTYSSVSTVGYSSITVLWGARATATFTQPVTFEWSTDGSTWNAVAFTNVNNNATWAWVNGGVRIALPTGADNVTNLRFRFSISSNNSGNYQIDDFSVEGTLAGKTSNGTGGGDWANANTWNPVGVPADGEAVTILAGDLVHTSASITRDAGTTVNGTFEIRNGGWATGSTAFTYGTNGTLNFNTTGGYTVNNTDVYWPAGTARPRNVNVVQGGMTLNGNRIVDGVFSTANGGSNGVTINNTLTVNGTCRIDAGGFFNTGNAPVYGNASTLIYNTGGTYNRSLEWIANGVGTIGTTPGYPNNVQLSGNTELNYNFGGPLAKAMNGDLTVDAGSHFNMNLGASVASPLTVGGNVVLNGTLTLGNVVGADLRLNGDFTSTGTFNGNSRAIIFIKTSGTQTVTSTGIALTIPYVVFNATGSRTVALGANTNVSISAPAGGNALSFGSAADVFSIGANTLIIGTNGVANQLVGAGTFSGLTSSNLTLRGTGNFSAANTLNFTTGSQNLGTFTIERTAGAVACALGTPVTINTGLVLTNGHVDLGNNTMTVTAAASISGGGANSYVIADVAAGANALLRKGISAAIALPGYTLPIGDNAASPNGSQYSPIAIAATSGTFPAGAYIGAAVNDIQHPNLDANVHYLTRYWNVVGTGFTSSTFTANGTYLDVDVVGTEASFINNRWNGTAWVNGGSPVNAGSNMTNAVSVAVGATNHITAGVRNQDINVHVSGTNYLTGSTYNFGSVAIGGTSAVTFTIQNLGFTTLAVTAPPSTAPTAPFVYTTPYAGGNISPSGSQTFIVTFTPTAAGPFSGSIVIPSNDPDEPTYTINFTGVGVVPNPDIIVRGNGIQLTTANTPDALNQTLFAAEDVGVTSAAKTHTIHNVGNVNLTLSGPAPYVTLSGANPGDFAVTVAPANSIAPSGSTNFQIRFTPSAGGLRTATVTIASNDPDTPNYVYYLAGTGRDREIEVMGNGTSITSGSVTVSAADNTYFGSVNVTGGSIVKQFVIYNTGEVSLNVTGISISGPDAASFSTTNVNTTLATNTEAYFSVTFDPSTPGVKNATISIANNDTDESPFTFAIQGNGADFTLCALGATEVIAQQDFELAPAGPVWTYAPSQELGAGMMQVTGGTAYGPNRTTAANKFIGARSFQVRGHSASSDTDNAKVTTVEFDAIDASEYQDVSLNFRLGAYSTVSGTGVGLDVTDEWTKVSISKDGGATWSEEITLQGVNNSIWGISGPGVASHNFDGNNIIYGFTTASGSTNTGPSNVTLANLPSSSQLKVRISFKLDRTDELFALDNVVLSGRRAATTTWTGTAWTNGAPTANVKAIFAGPYDTAANGNVSACACEFNAPVTVASNGQINIQDNYENNGSLTVESGGALIQVNNAAANSGNDIAVRRTTSSYKKFDYTYWSSPVSNEVIGGPFATWRLDYAFDYNTANFSDLITAETGVAPSDGFDDNGDDWNPVTAATPMIAAKGYAIMAPTTGTFPTTTTVTFNGPAHNGIYTMPLALSANAADTIDDFNLVGNPYPSQLDANAFITRNAIDNSFISGSLYFWTHYTAISDTAPGPDQSNFITADYATYTLMGGTSNGGPAPTRYIEVAQGFFVESQTGTQSLYFDNSMRSGGNASVFFRGAGREESGAAAGTSVDRIWLNMKNQYGLFSQQLIGFTDHTTLGVDTAYDGAVFTSGNTVSFYSLIDEVPFRIQARPAFAESDVIPLGFVSKAATEYDITIDSAEGLLAHSSLPVYLEDKYLGLVHNLRNSDYHFATSAGTFDNRFVLRFSDSSLGTDNHANASGIRVAVDNGAISVRSESGDLESVAVYDMLGREIYRSPMLSGTLHTIGDMPIQQQALVVKVTLKSGQQYSQKIVF